MKSAEVLGLLSSGEETYFIDFEEGLEQITTADIEEALDFIIARIFPEAFVVEVGFIKLHGRTLIAHHELLEVEETKIP